MRRFSSTACPWVNTRCASGFGAAVTAKEINEATRIAGTTGTLRPAESSWASIDIIRRQRHQALANSVNNLPLYNIRGVVNAAPKAPVAVDVKAQFTKGDFKDIAAMVQAYEEGMYNVRKLNVDASAWQIDIYGLKDNIKLGLNLFSQDVLDAKKKQLVITEAKMAKARAEIQTIMTSNFTTAIFNDIINVLRMAGSKQEHARDLGLRILDDMSMFGVALDKDTEMLLKNLTFGDGPQEDSNLLFTYCEFPERGEVSVSNESLEMIADSALKTIADRHQTPLTGSDDDFGKLLRMGDTHPLLQRSSD